MAESSLPLAVKVPPLPPELSRLGELACNLWWSWHPDARGLFKMLDWALWKESDHNPIKVLQGVRPERLSEAACDARFLTAYRSVIARLDADLGRAPKGELVAYFSPEFAVDSTLPIYSGGLGVLAGDHLKEASDSALPMAGVTLMYPKGYFHQRMLPDGWQEALDEEFRWLESPLRPLLDAEGRRLTVPVPLAERTVQVGCWQLAVGRSTLYLLDTDIEENRPEDRELTWRLYPGHPETQLKQYVVLGIGGVRLLRALGRQPAVWHVNEAHTGFLMVERILERTVQGETFDAAAAAVGRDAVFTTHTPLLHGSGLFARDLVGHYLAPYFGLLAVERDRFLDLGRLPDDAGAFSLAAMMLRLSGRANAVSRRHGEVSRSMWAPLWSGRRPEEVPVGHVTNGVHVPTWVSGEMYGLLAKYLGADWVERHDDEVLWRLLDSVPDEEFAQVRRRLKEKLIQHVLECCRRRWQQDPRDPAQAIAMGSLIDSRALTIGFCRRFTGYKRPLLVFKDLERLKRLLNDRWRPVQVLFAGKSHPADRPGHEMAQAVYRLAKDPALGGRVAFVEDYDMHTAKYLVQGVDVWLNNPLPPMEASGTSGMKAALNGVPSLSVLDGWWAEGFNGRNGWAVEAGSGEGDVDGRHAQAVYDLLEREIIPAYYQRDLKGVPVRWMKVCKEALAVAAVRFSARRMLREYRERIYGGVPAREGASG